MALETRTNARESGFTLTELMVALTVMVIVSAQVMASYSTMDAVSQSQERIIDSQREVRLVADMMLQDMRMAGFMVHEITGIGSVDGGTNASDVICMSDPAVMDTTIVEAATERFAGAEMTSNVTGSDSDLDLAVTTMDIDGDGTNDFTAQSGIIIADADSVHCARITSISGTTISFAPPTKSAFSALAADSLVVPAVVYEVNGTNLTRNNVILSDRIEDIQIEYGLDADSNGLIEGTEFPINDLDTFDRNLLEVARVHVSGRSPRAEPNWPGQFAAVANRTAGAADNFKRRRVIADATLRNLR